MFKVDPDPSFWEVVDIESPAPGGGVCRLELCFRYLCASAWKTYAATLDDKTILVALMEIVRDWRDVDHPFDEQAFERLLDNYPRAAGAIFSRYVDALLGAAEKNSAPPSASG